MTEILEYWKYLLSRKSKTNQILAIKLAVAWSNIRIIYHTVTSSAISTRYQVGVVTSASHSWDTRVSPMWHDWYYQAYSQRLQIPVIRINKYSNIWDQEQIRITAGPYWLQRNWSSLESELIRLPIYTNFDCWWYPPKYMLFWMQCFALMICVKYANCQSIWIHIFFLIPCRYFFGKKSQHDLR